MITATSRQHTALHHADFSWQEKYGHRDYRGGGRASARETAARVAAGAVARALLTRIGVDISAYVSSVGEIKLEKSYEELDLENIDTNEVRCPDPAVAEEMIRYIESVKESGDSVGGTVTGVVRGCPVGLGEPVFDKLHADLGKAMLSINAVKGFDYGSGFCRYFIKRIRTQRRVRGNKETGLPLLPTIPVAYRAESPMVWIFISTSDSSLRLPLCGTRNQLMNRGDAVTVKGKGRHDPCVLPRAVPIVEAMTALILADHLLRNQLARI